MTVLVGLDVGTTGAKAVAITPEGEVVARAEHGYPLSTPRPGWSEQDPEHRWQAAEAALAEVSAGHAVAGIGLSGQMHGLVTLDEADRVVRPAILWNDQRTAAECKDIETAVGLERLIELTGNRALPGFTAPKLLGCASTSPSRTRGWRGSACPRTTSGCGSRAHGRSMLPMPRGRCSSTSPHAAGATMWSQRSVRASGCRRHSSRRSRPARRTEACPSPPGPATRRPPRWASASTAGARLGRAG